MKSLLNKYELEQRVGLDITTIYRQMKEGRFPSPVQVGKRAVRWRVSDIEAWEAQLTRGVRRPGKGKGKS